MDDHAREQDRYLPIANVSRIMKRTLPDNAKIAKDAKECVQECVSEFIGFITSEAADRCLQEKRKTINGEDILWAMENLGFENYSEVLKLYLQRFRDQSKPPGPQQMHGAYDPRWVDHSQYQDAMKYQQHGLPPLSNPQLGGQIPQEHHQMPHQHLSQHPSQSIQQPQAQDRLPKLGQQEEESINI
eukprot:NODE_629_length_5211_cov_0.605243.p3 type:complete len:186 gc:universal NODE_629_length_5211_cov_0.605243:1636-1079(-)